MSMPAYNDKELGCQVDTVNRLSQSKCGMRLPRLTEHTTSHHVQPHQSLDTAAGGTWRTICLYPWVCKWILPALRG
jgi:hypothetical protein